MLKMTRLFLCLFLAVFINAPFAAQAASPEQNAIVARAETYLRNLTSAKARFVQTAPDGSQLAGTFYLSRPGKLRFEYDPPTKDFIVADGAFLYFYDSELNEQSNVPIGQTLADFILRENISLGGDLKVTSVKVAGGLEQITVVQKNDPIAGSLTLGFSQNPYRLSKWRVTDGQGMITEVALNGMQTGVSLPRSLFTFHKPMSGKPAYNQ